MKKNHVFPISSSTIFFHFCMMLASIYYVMLLTDWENPGLYTGNSDSRIKAVITHDPWLYPISPDLD